MSYKIKYEDFVKTYSKLYHPSQYYLEVLEKFGHGWNFKKISMYFRMPYHTVWGWTKRKTIPIPFVEYRKIKKEFTKREIDDLAIVIGHIFGDGGITNRGIVHYCNTEKFLINEFIEGVRKVFKDKPTIVYEKNIIRVKCPAAIGKIFWCLFNKFGFGKDTKTITPQIQKLPLEWKATMLKAWFNDDGSVINIYSNYKVIAIHQKLKPLIIFIRDTLKEFGINSQIMKDNNEWLLRICGYTNLIKFRDKINFSKGYRKNKELDIMIKSISRPHFIMKNKILELLKNSPKTRKEIAKLLGLNSGVVYGHLHGWKRKKRKSNLGLIDLGLVRFKKASRINVYIKKKEKW